MTVTIAETATDTLHDLILAVSAEFNEATTADLASAVAQRTPEDKVQDFYEEALVPKIRNVLDQERIKNMKHALSGNLTETPAQPQSQPEADPVTLGTDGGETPAPEKKAPVSPKIARRKSAWQKMLDSKLAVTKGQKRLGSCTKADLEFAIQRRHNHIAAVENSITKFEKLLELMTEYNVETVDQLPEQESDILGLTKEDLS